MESKHVKMIRVMLNRLLWSFSSRTWRQMLLPTRPNELIAIWTTPSNHHFIFSNISSSSKVLPHSQISSDCMIRLSCNIVAIMFIVTPSLRRNHDQLVVLRRSSTHSIYLLILPIHLSWLYSCLRNKRIYEMRYAQKLSRSLIPFDHASRDTKCFV